MADVPYHITDYATAPTPDVIILLVGHTDNQGSHEYNLGLSERRAQAVRAALVADFGIGTARIEAYGAGFLAPKASHGNAAGRARNRRVEMLLR